jgi:dipeptidyl aminopeptidase/acylaminoacyl peptidase
MGISGFSDGGWTVQFALINSDLFKVAAMGTCCGDKTAQPLAAGPRFTDYLREMGFIYFEPGGETFWQPMSLVQNVEAIDTPILIQASDSEYEGALDVFETYTHRGKPIEMFVFPNETHYKWQPAHRKVVYERNIEWFEFWLNHRMNCASSRSTQYQRWLAMEGAPSRSDLKCSVPDSSGP